jgi:ferredoxin-NADP reductase
MQLEQLERENIPRFFLRMESLFITHFRATARFDFLGADGNTRTFFIASPPFENELVFTTRIRDTAFKRSLKKVPRATEVKIGSAAGSFTLHKNRAKPAVFLAGGIGITPFLSIVRQADRDRLPHKLYLFYSNRRPEDAAFLDTLQTLVSPAIPPSSTKYLTTRTHRRTGNWRGRERTS